jgi:hypothetical protein
MPLGEPGDSASLRPRRAWTRRSDRQKIVDGFIRAPGWAGWTCVLPAHRCFTRTGGCGVVQMPAAGCCRRRQDRFPVTYLVWMQATPARWQQVGGDLISLCPEKEMSVRPAGIPGRRPPWRRSDLGAGQTTRRDVWAVAATQEAEAVEQQRPPSIAARSLCDRRYGGPSASSWETFPIGRGTTGDGPKRSPLPAQAFQAAQKLEIICHRTDALLRHGCRSVQVVRRDPDDGDWHPDPEYARPWRRWPQGYRRRATGCVRDIAGTRFCEKDHPE